MTNSSPAAFIINSQHDQNRQVTVILLCGKRPTHLYFTPPKKKSANLKQRICLDDLEQQFLHCYYMYSVWLYDCITLPL